MLICISGFATAGKSEAANGLPDVVRVSFASALKDEVAQELGISRAELDMRKMELRPKLVERGAGRRAEDIDYWVKKVAPVVEQELVKGNLVVIDDTRYVSEIRWAKSLGGKVVYVFRDGVTSANSEEHRSIQEIWEQNMVDSVIHNDSGIEELHNKMRRVAQMYAHRSEK